MLARMVHDSSSRFDKLMVPSTVEPSIPCGIALLVKHSSSFDSAQDGEPVEPYLANNEIR
jgi:hypothetical protein